MVARLGDSMANKKKAEEHKALNNSYPHTNSHTHIYNIHVHNIYMYSYLYVYAHRQSTQG